MVPHSNMLYFSSTEATDSLEKSGKAWTVFFTTHLYVPKKVLKMFTGSHIPFQTRIT